MNRRLRAWQLLVELLYGQDASLVAKAIDHAAGIRDALWTDVVSIANEHLVTAPLWSALQRRGLEATISTDIAEYLRTFHAFNAARNRAILAQLDELVGMLNRAGIEPMPLKGCAYLVSGLFPDPGDRYLSDVDLLVPEDAVASAQSILSQLGYRPAYERDYALHHHLVPMVHVDHPVAIEVHRSPVPRYAQSAMPAGELWIAGERNTTREGRSWAPSPTDTAMLSFLHSQIVDRNESLLLMPLRFFNDVLLFHRRHGANIDWSRNLERADRIGATGCLRRYLNVFRSLTGVAASSHVRASLADGAYFRACTAAVAWPVIARWAERADRLSRRAIEGKYGVSGGQAIGHYRLREVASMVRTSVRRKQP